MLCAFNSLGLLSGAEQRPAGGPAREDRVARASVFAAVTASRTMVLKVLSHIWGGFRVGAGSPNHRH
jgi:hypothetical protein